MILNLTTIRKVQLIGRWAGGRCLTATSVGNYTYLGDGGILKIIDISNPLSPALTDSLETPGVVQKILIDGALAYIADGIGGLRIIDISDHNNIFELGGYDSPGFTYSVAVSGNYAYLADGNSGVQVVNISNPANPFITKNVGFSKAYDVKIQSGFRICGICRFGT